MDRRVAPRVVLGVHLLVAIVHGATHGLVPVTLPSWQNALVVATVFVGPIVGVLLDERGHRLGLPLLAGSLAGAFLLGLILHVLVENPDHLLAVPASPWRSAFQLTGVAVTLVPAIGAAVAAWYYRSDVAAGDA